MRKVESALRRIASDLELVQKRGYARGKSLLEELARAQKELGVAP